MVVSKVELGKKNPNRANIYLDGEFSFAVGLDIVLKHGLKKGLEISDEEKLQMLEEDQYLKAWDRALKYLAYRKRTEKEIKDKLLSLEYAPFVVEDVLERLRAQRFVDDRDFAVSWVEDRLRLKPTGKKVLRLELLQKGVSSRIVDEVLADIDADVELEEALKIAAKRSFAALPPEEREKKLTSALLRKGFSWDIVKKVLKS